MGLGLAAFAVYLLTACRTIFGGDSAELAMAAAVFGVPHPPGYPLHTIVTGLLVHALPVGEVAFRANAASGLYAAAAVSLSFLFLRRLRVGVPGAAFAAATLAVGRTFWSQAVVAEVYTFDLLLLACVLHAAATLAARPAGRTALLCGLWIGLWVGHRTVNAIYVAPLAIALTAYAGPGRILRREVVLAGLAGLAISALVFVYLPLASLRDPALDIGDPESFARFKTVLTAAPYRRHLFAGTTGQDLGRFGRFLVSLPVVAGLAAPLAAWGWVEILRRSTWAAIGVGLGLVAGLAFGSRYHVLDVEVYFLIPTAVLVLLAGPGLQAALERLRAPALRGVALLVAAAGVAAMLSASWPYNDLSRHRFARVLGEELLASAEPDGVLFVTGDTSIHAVWYLQAVEGLAPGVIVVSLGHVWPWYHEQLVARHPDEPWPPPPPAGGLATAAYARAVLQRFAGRRPAYVAQSVDPAVLLGPDARTPGRLALRGMLQEIRPPGEELDETEGLARARENLTTLEAALRRMGPVPDELDMDTHSTVLEVSLALTVTAEALAAGGDVEGTARAAEAVASLRPDELERAVQRDVLRGLGQHVPALNLERRAQVAVQRAEARASAVEPEP